MFADVCGVFTIILCSKIPCKRICLGSGVVSVCVCVCKIASKKGTCFGEPELRKSKNESGCVLKDLLQLEDYRYVACFYLLQVIVYFNLQVH